MSKFEQVQQAIPQPVSWAVLVGPTVAAWLETLNPILTAVSLLVAIAWGALQIYMALKKRK